ncbi:hypothetical protein QN277_010471 [Acacia crassicarpa]|uniref:DUF7796 domain-containing protein n=1 Tax=Acacia crassicarpa TaxID=499986 RepID=A0AAE1INV2_9FABA|nr:hypothetical protein QN277_010471 [Acacia crassicarpa]
MTRSSIVDNILKQYPNSDLFLHSPLGKDDFNFSLLKNAPRVASVRIFQLQPLPETESEARVPIALNSPNALQLFRIEFGSPSLADLSQSYSSSPFGSFHLISHLRNLKIVLSFHTKSDVC